LDNRVIATPAPFFSVGANYFPWLSLVNDKAIASLDHLEHRCKRLLLHDKFTVHALRLMYCTCVVVNSWNRKCLDKDLARLEEAGLATIAFLLIAAMEKEPPRTPENATQTIGAPALKGYVPYDDKVNYPGISVFPTESASYNTE